MSITVRPLRSDEARAYLAVHERAIRGLAVTHYPSEVIDAWVVPVNDTTTKEFARNPEGEIRLAAESDGELVGVGALVVAQPQLRACYVVPEAARQGCGAAIVAEIERLAREHGLMRLEVTSSLNAEPFYAALGYTARSRTEHTLLTGYRLAAVNTTKQLL